MAAAVSGCVGLFVLATFYTLRPAFAFEMDRALLTTATGFYGVERDGANGFVWTSGRAVLRFPGLSRSSAWSCVVRFRGARPPGVPQPILTVSVDGVNVGWREAVGEYQDLSLTLAERDAPGATVAFQSDPVFTPGGSDSRTLGVQIDRFACEPRRAIVPAPVLAMRAVGMSSAAFAGAAALVGTGLLASIATGLVVAIGLSTLLVSNAAAYGSYPQLTMQVGLAFPAVLVLASVFVSRLARQPLAPYARGALVATVVAGCLKLLGLAHPAKPVVDALFQAHRLASVLDGQYFFTQPMPDGVVFPYAIGLYVVAALWTWVTTDHVLLLRAVVVLAEAFAGGLLYLAAVRAWSDARAGFWAVVLFHFVPLPYVVMGNGNLTNAFGQSAALVTVAAAVVRPWNLRSIGWIFLVAALASLAFLSHISTLALLGAILGALIVVLATAGSATLRSTAAALTLAAVLAAGTSIAIYYRHFGDVYVHAARAMRDGPGSPAAATTGPGRSGDEAAPLVPGVGDRLAVAARETVGAIGWPVLLLAAVGVWLEARRLRASAAGSAILAWLSVWLVVSAVTVATRVDAQFNRYAVEFLGRLNLAVYPAIVLLAARAATVHVAALVVVGAAVWIGVQAWLNWFF
jgi:hypothetical protein